MRHSAESAAAAAGYEEPGSGPAPLLWGPGFAVVGFLLDLATAARPHVVAWIVVGVVLLLCGAVWVYARRRFMSVRVTGSELVQGDERLHLERIAEVRDDAAPVAGRVLGGGFTVPRKREQVALRLDDGSTVLAWARDPDRLRSALRQAIGK